jgi:hypothetical protein
MPPQLKVSDLVEFRDAGCVRYGEVCNTQCGKVFVTPLEEIGENVFSYSRYIWELDPTTVKRSTRTYDGYMLTEGWHFLGFAFESYDRLIPLEYVSDTDSDEIFDE